MVKDKNPSDDGGSTRRGTQDVNTDDPGDRVGIAKDTTRRARAPAWGKKSCASVSIRGRSVPSSEAATSTASAPTIAPMATP